MQQEPVSTAFLSFTIAQFFLIYDQRVKFCFLSSQPISVSQASPFLIYLPKC